MTNELLFLAIVLHVAVLWRCGIMQLRMVRIERLLAAHDTLQAQRFVDTERYLFRLEDKGDGRSYVDEQSTKGQHDGDTGRQP